MQGNAILGNGNFPKDPHHENHLKSHQVDSRIRRPSVRIPLSNPQGTIYSPSRPVSPSTSAIPFTNTSNGIGETPIPFNKSQVKYP